MKAFLPILRFTAALIIISETSQAATVVYEGFNYPDLGGAAGDDPLNGLNGGLGWGGAWISDSDATDADYQIDSPGLTFGSLAVEGNSTIRQFSSNRAITNRSISPVSQTVLLNDATTMWFSVLLSSGGSGEDFAFFFGDSPHSFPSSGGGDPGVNGGSNAFGVALISGSLFAIDHENDERQNLSATSTSPGSGVKFVVGKINWNTVGTDDELFLFNVTDASDPEPLEASAFATHTADFNQSTFDVISFWDRPNFETGLDEIRLATSYNGALGIPEPLAIPEPSSLALLSLAAIGLLARRR